MSNASDHVERIREQFTRQADPYARMQQTRDDRGLDALVALCGTQASDRVLDVACGPGFLTLAFARRASHVTGVDATEALLDLARREARSRGIENVRFQTGRAEALDLPDAGFELVSCRAAFHHFPDPAAVLAEMRRVVKPGGRLLVADLLGSEEPEQAAYHDQIERLCDPTHTRALPLSAFESLFEEAGLEVLAQPTSTLSYDADEWMAHGGPDATTAKRIRELLEASLERDRSGLEVQRVDGRLRFRHRTAAFLLRKPAR